MYWGFGAPTHSGLNLCIISPTLPSESSFPTYRCAVPRNGGILGGRTFSLVKVPVISVVDDDQSMRDATGRLVRSLGFNVATFASAEDFLESARVGDTSCLITDVQMPGLSGVELQSRLIADGRHMPIIGITAHPEESIRTQMLEAGAVGFLHKPFKDECLINCLATALKSRDNQH
jgi:FixJ family two-component response regulator